MTFYGLYGQRNTTGASNTVTIPVESGKEYTIVIWVDSYSGYYSRLSSMTGATVLSTLSERSFSTVDSAWIHIRRVKATENTITLTGTMGASHSNIVWAALFTA